jgi:xanthine dehydrogenase accessory factor
MNTIYEEMESLRRRAEPFVLATVITRNGSAPRAAGAKMLIRQDGVTAGTVGGGILEAQVKQVAAEMTRSHQASVQAFQFTGKDAAAMDAICGGQVEVLVEWMDPGDPQTDRIIQLLQAAIHQHHKIWLVTGLPTPTTGTTHTLVQPDGRIIGTLLPDLSLERVVEARQPGLVELGLQKVLIEPINISGAAYIFGAGHVSRSLAGLTKMVGFWTAVLDDRAEYANCERFPEVDELIVLDSFSDAARKIQIDRDSFIVIVTRGHMDDLTVLAQVIKSDAAYIGMIGSRRKCELTFQELRRLGFSEADIQRVHAPIGLPIEAETPEEIGVSIVAEMIQIRAKLMRDSGE